MSGDIFILAEHHQGVVTAATHELLGKASELAGSTGDQVVACLLGHNARALAQGLAADVALYVDDPALENFVPEAYVKTLASIIVERAPQLLLIGNSTVGMDVAGVLSARVGQSLVAYCTEIKLEGDMVVTKSQVYGGKLEAEVATETPATLTVVAGSFPPAAAGSPTVEDVTPPDLSVLQTEFLERVEPEVEDIDISTQDILLAVGRGIGSEENIELAQELAEALGAALSASRPVTDAGWLPKTRQVGKSGQKVKPKLYIACGISGAPEHLEGMSGAELIIAINTDENAPIFEVAHYGTTEDMFDLLPALADRLRAMTAT